MKNYGMNIALIKARKDEVKDFMENILDETLDLLEISECIICGRPTFQKGIWHSKQKENISNMETPHRFIYYPICECYYMNEYILQYIENKLIKEFNL